MAALIVITAGTHRFEFTEEGVWVSPSGDREMADLLNRAAPYPGPSAGDPLEETAQAAAAFVGGIIQDMAPHPKTKGNKVY